MQIRRNGVDILHWIANIWDFVRSRTFRCGGFMIALEVAGSQFQESQRVVVVVVVSYVCMPLRTGRLRLPEASGKG